MRLFTLGARLETAASFIPPGSVVVDIGTDHARLQIWLVKTGRCTHVTASDIADIPIRRARENVARWEVSRMVRVIQGAGFDGIAPGSFTHAVICGMGGETICAILQEANRLKDPNVRLLLQPMTDFALLRRFLSSRGSGILDEEIVESEHRLYQCLAVSFTGCPYTLTEAEAEVGPLNIKRRDPVFLRYVRRRAGIVQACMDGKRAAGADCAREHALLASYMKILQEECL